MLVVQCNTLKKVNEFLHVCKILVTSFVYTKYLKTHLAKRFSLVQRFLTNLPNDLCHVWKGETSFLRTLFLLGIRCCTPSSPRLSEACGAKLFVLIPRVTSTDTTLM